MPRGNMHGFFYGWYLKCQSDTQTLAVIPAVHKTGRKHSCSVQMITEQGAWTVPFSSDVFRRKKNRISIGVNRFGTKGIRLAIHTPELNIRGRLEFGPLFPLRYDIMGPFSFVPFLECRHSVWSMLHTVNGRVVVNGQEYCFRNDRGYWEGDRGRSFPEKYVWTQCCFAGGSLMLSVADIPIAGLCFTGIICVILWCGKEYRLATYLGAKAVHIGNGVIQIAQKDMKLEAGLLERQERPLKAPAGGDMIRTIHESAACTAYYRFQKGKRTIFAFQTDRASFEYEYPY